jgi:hypothetical protein
MRKCRCNRLGRNDFERARAAPSGSARRGSLGQCHVKRNPESRRVGLFSFPLVRTAAGTRPPTAYRATATLGAPRPNSCTGQLSGALRAPVAPVRPLHAPSVVPGAIGWPHAPPGQPHSEKKPTSAPHYSEMPLINSPGVVRSKSDALLSERIPTILRFIEVVRERSSYWSRVVSIMQQRKTAPVSASKNILIGDLAENYIANVSFFASNLSIGDRPVTHWGKHFLKIDRRLHPFVQQATSNDVTNQNIFVRLILGLRTDPPLDTSDGPWGLAKIVDLNLPRSLVVSGIMNSLFPRRKRLFPVSEQSTTENMSAFIKFRGFFRALDEIPSRGPQFFGVTSERARKEKNSEGEKDNKNVVVHIHPMHKADNGPNENLPRLVRRHIREIVVGDTTLECGMCLGKFLFTRSQGRTFVFESSSATWN